MTAGDRSGREPRRGLLTTLVAVGALVLVLAAVAVGLALRPESRSSRSASSVTRGNGQHATERREVPPFAGVDLAGAVPVTVRVGRPQRVQVEADRNLLPHVTTRVQGGVLVVGTTGSITTRAPTRVTVTAPTVRLVVLSGSGTVDATGVRVGSLQVELSGSGRITVTGSSDVLRAELSGSGQLSLEGLQVRTATARLDGVGEIAVFVTQRLTADVAGTGTIRYAGDPGTVRKQVTGTGAVSPG